MKKQILMLATAIMLIVTICVSSFSVFAASKTMYGDITNDGYVSVSDVISLLQLLANDGIGDFTSAQKKIADVTCDDRIDVSDVIRILQFLASPGSTVLGPEQSEDITITVGSISASAGETVTIPISIENNTGIAGATLTITYSPKLTLTNAVNGTAFSSFVFTHTEGLHNPSNLMWDSQDGEVSEDGVIANLTFTVPSGARVGDRYEVKCTYRNGDIFNADWEDLEPVIIDGAIIVK